MLLTEGEHTNFSKSAENKRREQSDNNLSSLKKMEKAEAHLENICKGTTQCVRVCARVCVRRSLSFLFACLTLFPFVGLDSLLTETAH